MRVTLAGHPGEDPLVPGTDQFQQFSFIGHRSIFLDLGLSGSASVLDTVAHMPPGPRADGGSPPGPLAYGHWPRQTRTGSRPRRTFPSVER